MELSQLRKHVQSYSRKGATLRTGDEEMTFKYAIVLHQAIVNKELVKVHQRNSLLKQFKAVCGLGYIDAEMGTPELLLPFRESGTSERPVVHWRLHFKNARAIVNLDVGPREIHISGWKVAVTVPLDLLTGGDSMHQLMSRHEAFIEILNSPGDYRAERLYAKLQVASTLSSEIDLSKSCFLVDGKTLSYDEWLPGTGNAQAASRFSALWSAICSERSKKGIVHAGLDLKLGKISQDARYNFPVRSGEFLAVPTSNWIVHHSMSHRLYPESKDSEPAVKETQEGAWNSFVYIENDRVNSTLRQVASTGNFSGIRDPEKRLGGCVVLSRQYFFETVFIPRFARVLHAMQIHLPDEKDLRWEGNYLNADMTVLAPYCKLKVGAPEAEFSTQDKTYTAFKRTSDWYILEIKKSGSFPLHKHVDNDATGRPGSVPAVSWVKWYTTVDTRVLIHWEGGKVNYSCTTDYKIRIFQAVSEKDAHDMEKILDSGLTQTQYNKARGLFKHWILAHQNICWKGSVGIDVIGKETDDGPSAIVLQMKILQLGDLYNDYLQDKDDTIDGRESHWPYHESVKLNTRLGGDREFESSGKLVDTLRSTFDGVTSKVLLPGAGQIKLSSSDKEIFFTWNGDLIMGPIYYDDSRSVGDDLTVEKHAKAGEVPTTTEPSKEPARNAPSNPDSGSKPPHLKPPVESPVPSSDSGRKRDKFLTWSPSKANPVSTPELLEEINSGQTTKRIEPTEIFIEGKNEGTLPVYLKSVDFEFIGRVGGLGLLGVTNFTTNKHRRNNDEAIISGASSEHASPIEPSISISELSSREVKCTATFRNKTITKPIVIPPGEKITFFVHGAPGIKAARKAARTVEIVEHLCDQKGEVEAGTDPAYVTHVEVELV